MRMLLLMMIVTALPGCSAMMIGGNSAGAYEAGTQERTAAQIAADSDITITIRDLYAESPMLERTDVAVSTVAGKVTLAGRVGSYAVRETAERLAIQIDGVKAVDNQIEVQDLE